MTSEFPRPRLVSAPEVLHDSDGWVLWHSGVTDGPHGLQTVVEVIDTSGRDRVTGPAWNVGERDRWPIEVTATEGATDPVTPKAFSEESTPRSYRLFVSFGRYGKRLGPRPDTDEPVLLTFTVPPLDVRVERALT
ncbi:hypothetical protein OG792_04810 [Micromonospora sp. NBC_01699]|uniref:hypothetical protein n=1 Tax=Micromonospora sp. NBC_01699 TaxID=2975984 RepID=UPI002E367802|nr:hypothetical protein [Micromonospora sp. NBC_01699]